VTTLLLDTHALLWWLAGDDRLPAAVRILLEDPRNSALVSAASAWEISIKTKLGKLQSPSGLLEAADQTGLRWVPITPEEAYEAGQLPMHHRDPFDRLLVAQASAHSARLISRDQRLDLYGVDRVWS
jgi:PIN domain nuclease of toxin-antitoxin system